MRIVYLLGTIILLVLVAYSLHLRRKVRRHHKTLTVIDDVAIASLPVNLVVLLVALASLVYAKVSFDSSEKTSAFQLVMSQRQQKALDDSSAALADMVKLANDQQTVTSKNLDIAKHQQSVLSQQLDRMTTLSQIAEEQWQKQIQDANQHPIP